MGYLKGYGSKGDAVAVRATDFTPGLKLRICTVSCCTGSQ
jgi:hypothetical protein